MGLGLAAVDLIGEVTEIPKADETTFMLSYDKQAGGPVSNALATVSRLGMEAAWIGKAGDDEYGDFILEEMKKDEVDTRLATVEAGSRSPLSFILIDQKTQGRSIIFNPGCSGFYGSEVPDDIIKQFDVLHLDGCFLDAAFSSAEKAKKLGVKVSLDAGLVFPGLDTLLKRVDIFVPTREVALELTKEADAAQAMKKLTELGPEIVAVTMGKEGSAGLSGDEVVKVPAFEVKAVDTTAAGDVFHGAFVFAYLKGWDIEKILTFSSAVSAVKCTRRGARKGIPRFDEVIAFLKERDIDVEKDW